MSKIRVLFANSPLMVPAAIRNFIEGQADMEVVGDFRGPMKILQETGRTLADAVILIHEGTDEPGLCSQLLAAYPDLTILGVAPDMRSAFVQRMCPQRRDTILATSEDCIRVLTAAVRNTEVTRQ